MRYGWDCKNAAAVLDVHHKRLTQALNPAAEKFAKLWRVNPNLTMQTLMAAVDALPPMTDAEISIRLDMLRGTLPRSAVHPSTRQ